MYTPISDLVDKDIHGLNYIWGDDFYNILVEVKHDPNNAGKFLVTYYCDSGKHCTDKNVDGDRLAYRDNEDELQAELARLQDENRRLRAFVEWCATGNLDNNQMGLVEDKATALLASIKPAEDSK